MMDFDPLAPHIFWFNRWRHNIDRAREGTSEQDGYSHAACIAQMMYLTYMTLERAKEERP
jgi:hypothetical protein